MNISIYTLVVLSLFSIQSFAQNYPINPGKIYSGVTHDEQNCSLQLASENNGWTVSLGKMVTNQLTFNSHNKIEIRNSAWISRDMMKLVSTNQFESSNQFNAGSKIFNVLMKCKLNSKNEPIAFTIDAREVNTNQPFKRLVDCEIRN